MEVCHKGNFRMFTDVVGIVSIFWRGNKFVGKWQERVVISRLVEWGQTKSSIDSRRLRNCFEMLVRVIFIPVINYNDVGDPDKQT